MKKSLRNKNYSKQQFVFSQTLTLDFTIIISLELKTIILFNNCIPSPQFPASSPEKRRDIGVRPTKAD